MENLQKQRRKHALIAWTIFSVAMIGKYVTTNEFMLVFSCFSGFFGVIFGRCLGQMVFGRVTNVVHPWYFELKVLWELLTGRFEREYDIVQKDTHKSEK